MLLKRLRFRAGLKTQLHTNPSVEYLVEPACENTPLALAMTEVEWWWVMNARPFYSPMRMDHNPLYLQSFLLLLPLRTSWIALVMGSDLLGPTYGWVAPYEKSVLTVG